MDLLGSGMKLATSNKRKDEIIEMGRCMHQHKDIQGTISSRAGRMLGTLSPDSIKERCLTNGKAL